MQVSLLEVSTIYSAECSFSPRKIIYDSCFFHRPETRRKQCKSSLSHFYFLPAVGITSLVFKSSRSGFAIHIARNVNGTFKYGDSMYI